MGKPLEAEGPLKAVSTFAGKRINTETTDNGFEQEEWKGTNTCGHLCGRVFVFPTDVVCVSVHVWISLRCQIPGLSLSWCMVFSHIKTSHLYVAMCRCVWVSEWTLITGTGNLLGWKATALWWGALTKPTPSGEVGRWEKGKAVKKKKECKLNFVCFHVGLSPHQLKPCLLVGVYLSSRAVSLSRLYFWRRFICKTDWHPTCSTVDDRLGLWELWKLGQRSFWGLQHKRSYNHYT